MNISQNQPSFSLSLFICNRFPIHRVILTAASKYFAASLGPNFQGSQQEEFIFDETDFETLQAIVGYCYTGHIHLTEENVRTCLTIASSVQFDLLEETCCSFYARILNGTNCVDALIFADKFSYLELRDAALDWISENFEYVPATDIQKLDHPFLEKILKCDRIISSEELVFIRLLEWAEIEERKKYMPDFLKMIRLEHVSFEVRFFL